MSTLIERRAATLDRDGWCVVDRAIDRSLLADIKRDLEPSFAAIRDFLLCPASQIKLENGRPIRWTVAFAFNSKGPAGGHTGLTSYIVGFKNGVIALHATSSMMTGDGAFNHIINDAIIKAG